MRNVADVCPLDISAALRPLAADAVYICQFYLTFFYFFAYFAKFFEAIYIYLVLCYYIIVERGLINMLTIIRLYGAPKKSPDMYEVPYIELDFDTCEIISEGTEDFSPERFRSYLKCTVLEKVKDSGEKYPSGNTKWDRYGLIILRASRADYPKARRLYTKIYAQQGFKLR